MASWQAVLHSLELHLEDWCRVFILKNESSIVQPDLSEEEFQSCLNFSEDNAEQLRKLIRLIRETEKFHLVDAIVERLESVWKSSTRILQDMKLVDPSIVNWRLPRPPQLPTSMEDIKKAQFQASPNSSLVTSSSKESSMGATLFQERFTLEHERFQQKFHDHWRRKILPCNVCGRWDPIEFEGDYWLEQWNNIFNRQEGHLTAPPLMLPEDLGAWVLEFVIEWKSKHILCRMRISPKMQANAKDCPQTLQLKVGMELDCGWKGSLQRVGNFTLEKGWWTTLWDLSGDITLTESLPIIWLSIYESTEVVQNQPEVLFSYKSNMETTDSFQLLCNDSTTPVEMCDGRGRFPPIECDDTLSAEWEKIRKGENGTLRFVRLILPVELHGWIVELALMRNPTTKELRLFGFLPWVDQNKLSPYSLSIKLSVLIQLGLQVFQTKSVFVLRRNWYTWSMMWLVTKTVNEEWPLPSVLVSVHPTE